LQRSQARGHIAGGAQVVGLCPAAAAGAGAAGRLLEGRLAAAAARSAAARCEAMGDEEHSALATRLRREADVLAGLGVEQDSLLGGAERTAALVPVLRAAEVWDGELDALLAAAARGLRLAVSEGTEAIYRTRVAALDSRLASP